MDQEQEQKKELEEVLEQELEQTTIKETQDGGSVIACCSSD